jgi:hypothetical protein
VHEREPGLEGRRACGIEELGEERELLLGDPNDAAAVAARLELVLVGLDARDGAGAVVVE